jgi:vacuolar-type H+-ATPase subunit H
MVNKKISEFILYSYHALSYPEVFSFIKEKEPNKFKIMELSEKAKEAQRRQLNDWRRRNREHRNKKEAEWREKNREHVREYQREWKKRNPEKVKRNHERYWERKAKKLNIANNNHESLKKNPNEIETKVCQECGTPVSGRKKYCSQKCKQKAYRKNKKK